MLNGELAVADLPAAWNDKNGSASRRPMTPRDAYKTFIGRGRVLLFPPLRSR